MSSPYVYCYEATQFEGVINGIEVRWQPTGKEKLTRDAGVLEVPEETLKRMCEHHGYLLAYRLQSSRVAIKSGPHSFSVDSKTGKRSNDGDHFTVEVSGGPYGRRKAHIYLGGHGFGAGAYDNIVVSAESVMDKKGKSIDMTLSTGNPSMAGGSGSVSGYGMTAGNAGSGGTTGEGYEAGAGSGTATSGASAWGSTYTTTGGYQTGGYQTGGYQAGGYQAGGGSGQESTSGEWVWSPEHRMYYHSGTGEWAPPQQ